MCFEQIDHAERSETRHQRRTLLPHVTAVFNGAHGRGIGRRATNTELFELLDQRGFGITRWGLSLVTTGFEFAGVQIVALSNLGQCRSAGLIVVGITVDVDLAETLVGDHGAASREGGGGACGGSNTDTNLDGFAGGIGHLRGDRALPDQFVDLGFAFDALFGHGLR